MQLKITYLAFLSFIIICGCTSNNKEKSWSITTEKIELQSDAIVKRNVRRFLVDNENHSLLKNFELLKGNNLTEHIYTNQDRTECSISLIPNIFAIKDSSKYNVDFIDLNFGPINNYMIFFKLNKRNEVTTFYVKLYYQDGQTNTHIILNTKSTILLVPKQPDSTI